MSGDLQIRFYEDINEFDLVCDDCDLLTDEAFSSAVYLSLFTDRRARDDDSLPDANSEDKRGWWGDAIGADVKPDDSMGSRLWLLERASTIQNSLLLAEQYAKEALQWMIDDGLAKSIEVETQRTYIEPGSYRLDFKVMISKTGGEPLELNFSYDTEWNVQFDKGLELPARTSGICVCENPVVPSQGSWHYLLDVGGFEAYNNGNLTGQNSWGTPAASAGSGQIEVVGAIYEGLKAAHFYADDGNYKFLVATESTTDVIIQFAVWLKAGIAAPEYARAVVLQSDHSTVGAVNFLDNVIQWRIGSTTPFVDETWYRIRLVYKRATSRTDCYLDGVLQYGNLILQGGPGDGSFGGVLFDAGPALDPGEYMAIDNLTVIEALTT